MTLKTLGVLVVIAVIVGLVTHASPVSVAIAVLAGWLIMKVGYAAIAGLGMPVPEPPPPGELRKVRIMFRCSICGTEVRMTSANDEVPEPPKHCLEEMDLVAPVME
jgi:hypothetical protein